MKWEALYDNLPTWCGYRYDQTNEGLLDMQYVHRITSNKNATYEQAISNESHRLNQIKEFFFSLSSEGFYSKSLLYGVGCW
jgi:hypothetical protein